MASRTKGSSQKKFTFDRKTLVELIGQDGKPYYVDIKKLGNAEKLLPMPPASKIPKLSPVATQSHNLLDGLHISTFDAFHPNQSNGQCPQNRDESGKSLWKVKFGSIITTTVDHQMFARD